jgi:ferritin-like metal-binding protein YciE
LPDNSTDLIRLYLQDALAAESSFESQLRSFANDGDDEEVQSFFALHADQTRFQYDRLFARLQELNGTPSGLKTFLADALGFAPKTAQAVHSPEERIVQNLIAAFSIEHAECAIYESLATVARTANDAATESLARQIQAEEREASTKVWRFIPSRAKIAFNTLTAGEIDPSVETRAPANRVLS